MDTQVGGCGPVLMMETVVGLENAILWGAADSDVASCTNPQTVTVKFTPTGT